MADAKAFSQEFIGSCVPRTLKDAIQADVDAHVLDCGRSGPVAKKLKLATLWVIGSLEEPTPSPELLVLRRAIEATGFVTSREIVNDLTDRVGWRDGHSIEPAKDLVAAGLSSIVGSAFRKNEPNQYLEAMVTLGQTDGVPALYFSSEPHAPN